jgi:opacity protein-like surface antigen
MYRCKALVVASIGALALTAAHAADMPRFPLPDVEKPPSITTEFVSGWYLRGDLGYRYGKLDSIEGTAAPATNPHYDNTITAGGGFGYKHKWLRADLTFDYGVRGTVKGDAGAIGSYVNGRLDTFTGLANVYLDMGTWGGVTPYIGAGIGGSRLNMTDLQVGGLGPVAPRDVWRWSWAWMAGLSWQFMPNLALDVGYRYLKLGDAESTNPVTNDPIRFKNIAGSEIRVGLRLLID